MFSRERRVKSTLKEHHCIGCQRIFPIGSSSLIYCAGMWDCSFYHYYFCDICNDYIKEFPEWVEDGFSEGQIFSEGWGHPDETAWIDDWISKNKPLCIEYAGHWRRKKGQPYERLGP